MIIDSKFTNVGNIELPFIDGEHSMIPFNLSNLEPLTGVFRDIAHKMTKHINVKKGTAYLTVHGKTLKANGTLRRGGAHTDGNYAPLEMSFGGGGWKIGENGPAINTEFHSRQYLNPNGGIILATNYPSAVGYRMKTEGMIGVGGDCSKLEKGEPELLNKDVIYYGNNHFVHESLPVGRDVHRVFARVTLPETHEYEGD